MLHAATRAAPVQFLVRRRDLLFDDSVAHRYNRAYMAGPVHNDGSGPRRPQTREQVVEVLRSHRRELDEFGVRQLSLFGSVARGDCQPHSDVDMVVQFSSTTYRRFVGLKSFLESILDRKVDLLTAAAVQGRLKEQIEKDLVHVPT